MEVFDYLIYFTFFIKLIFVSSTVYLKYLELPFEIPKAKYAAKNIPRKAPIKLGFPKVPRMFPYGLFQGMKSPKMTTQRQ